MLLDVNVLLALSWDSHVHHDGAHEHFSRLKSWHTCPTTEMGLLRLLLTRAVVGRPVSGAEALDQLRLLRGVPGWSFLGDDSTLAEPKVMAQVLTGRKQVTDLHLVNLAASGGTKLATFDTRIADALAPDDRRWVEIWK